MAVRLWHLSSKLPTPLVPLLLSFNFIFNEHSISLGVEFDDSSERYGAELLDWPHKAPSDYGSSSLSDGYEKVIGSTDDAEAANKTADAAESRATQATTATAPTEEKPDKVSRTLLSASGVAHAATAPKKSTTAEDLKPKRDGEDEKNLRALEREAIIRENLEKPHVLNNSNPTLFVGENAEKEVHDVAPPREINAAAFAAAKNQDIGNMQTENAEDHTQEQLPAITDELFQRQGLLHERQDEAAEKEREERDPNVIEQYSDSANNDPAGVKETEAAEKVEVRHSELEHKPTEEEAKVAPIAEKPFETPQKQYIKEKAKQREVDEEKLSVSKTGENPQSVTSYSEELANHVKNASGRKEIQEKSATKNATQIAVDETPESQVVSTVLESREKSSERDDAENPEKMASSPALVDDRATETAHRGSSESGRTNTLVEKLFSTGKASPTAVEAKETDLTGVGESSSLEAAENPEYIREDTHTHIHGTTPKLTSTFESIKAAIVSFFKRVKSAVQNALSLQPHQEEVVQQPQLGNLRNEEKATMPHAENRNKETFKELADAIHANRIALQSFASKLAASRYGVFPIKNPQTAKHARSANDSGGDIHGDTVVKGEQNADDKSIGFPYDHYAESAAGERGSKARPSSLTPHSFEAERAHALRGGRSKHRDLHSGERFRSSSDSRPEDNKLLPTNILTESKQDKEALTTGFWRNFPAVTVLPSSEKEASVKQGNLLNVLRDHEESIMYNIKRLSTLLERKEREHQRAHDAEQYETGAESTTAMREGSKQQDQQEEKDSQTEETGGDSQTRSADARGNDAFQQGKPDSTNSVESKNVNNEALQRGTSNGYKSRSIYVRSDASLASLERSFQTVLQRFDVSLRQINYGRNDVLENIAIVTTTMEESLRAFDLEEAKQNLKTVSPEELMERLQAAKDASIALFALIATAQKRAESVLAFAEFLKVTQHISTVHLTDALKEEMQQDPEEPASSIATEKEKTLHRQQQVERGDKLGALSEAFHAVEELGSVVAHVTWAVIIERVAIMQERAMELLEQMKNNIEMASHVLRELEGVNSANRKKQPSKNRWMLMLRPMNALAQVQQKLELANQLSRERGDWELLEHLFRYPEKTAAKQQVKAQLRALKDKGKNAWDTTDLDSESSNVALKTASGVSNTTIESKTAKQAALSTLRSSVPTIIISVLLAFVLLLFIALVVYGYYMIASYGSRGVSGHNLQESVPANEQNVPRVVSTDWRE